MSNWNGKHGEGARRLLRELRREEAEARTQRTAKEQLKVLDDRLGEGKGAVKERARLTGLSLPTGEAVASVPRQRRRRRVEREATREEVVTNAAS